MYRLTFETFKSTFPTGVNAALTATLGIAGFTYDQFSQSCSDGKSYDWKTNKCELSTFPIPIPVPNL